jgi:hypothetical protein
MEYSWQFGSDSKLKNFGRTREVIKFWTRRLKKSRAPEIIGGRRAMRCM